MFKKLLEFFGISAKNSFTTERDSPEVVVNATPVEDQTHKISKPRKKDTKSKINDVAKAIDSEKPAAKTRKPKKSKKIEN
jgi:hypothetical protein